MAKVMISAGSSADGKDRNTRKAALALALLGALAGCEKKTGTTAEPTAAAECTELRAHLDRAQQTMRAASKPMTPDAPIEAVVENTEALSKAAKEVAADFGKFTPKRPDIADSASGIKMLGELAGQKLETFAGTLRSIGGKLGDFQKLQMASMEAAKKLGQDPATPVGCGDKTPPAACAPVMAAIAQLSRQQMPMNSAEAAKVEIGRADALEALAKAVEGLPPAPDKQKAREEVAKNAREAATASRALAKPLEESAPIEEKLGKERQAAQEATSRLATEIDAAGKICAPPGGSASASAAAPPSGAPRAPLAPKPGPAGSGAPAVPAPH